MTHPNALLHSNLVSEKFYSHVIPIATLDQRNNHSSLENDLIHWISVCYRKYTHTRFDELTSVPSPLKKLSTCARSLSLSMPLLSGLKLCNSESDPLRNSESVGWIICVLVGCVHSMPCSYDSDAEPSDESLGGALSPIELNRARPCVSVDIVWKEKIENKIENWLIGSRKRLTWRHGTPAVVSVSISILNC